MLVPTEVGERKQWMLWRLEYGTKVPYQTNGRRAKSNDPGTWTTLDEVQASQGDYTGKAFIFAEDDPFCGVDLDDCIEGGVWQPWAEEIRERLRGVAYGEISPSGTGVKFTTRADKPAGSRCTNQKGVECYDRKRFWTWTGNCLGEGFDKIGDGQEAIDWLIETHLKASPRETGQRREVAAAGGSLALLARAEAYVDTVHPGVKGDLRNGAFRLAGHLHSLLGDDGERLSDTDVLGCLRRWNMRGADQLREDELREAAVNGRKNGTPPADKPAVTPLVTRSDDSDVDLSGILGRIIEETPEDVPFSPGDFPRDAIPTTGILGELIAYNLATSMFPQPELALAGGLALLSALTGRKVQDTFGGRSNVYLLGLGESGAGKEHARKLNKKLLYEIGADGLIGPERIGSSAGLTVAVKERLSCLFQIDEIGHLLATMKNASKSPHLFNIATVLMQMYSSADSVWIGDAYADSKKTPTIEQPHAVVYGTCTPEGFWVNLSSDSVANGLLGRMLVFESPGRVTRQRPAKMSWPQSLLDAARWWWEFNPGGIDKSKPVPITVEHDTDAMSRYEQHVNDICDRQSREASDAAALWSRTGEKTAKLALLFACSRQQYTASQRINLDDVNRAIAISNWLTRRMLKQAHEYVASNLIEDNKKRVLRAIGSGITMNGLSRKTQWLRAKERTEILLELSDRGDIAIRDEATGGRSKRLIERLT